MSHGRHAIPVALSLLMDRIMADNPIVNDKCVRNAILDIFPTRFSREMQSKCANPRFLSHFRPETYQRKADLEHFDPFLAHSGRQCIGSGPRSACRRRIGEWT